MKNSEPQHRASQTINSLINQAISIADDSRKQIKRTIEWLNSTKQYIQKIHLASIAVRKVDTKVHPHLTGSVNGCMQCLTEACDPVIQVIGSALISRAENFITQCSRDISEIGTALKDSYQSLCNSFEEFYSQMKKGFQQNARDSLEVGFKSHCNYLTYFNNINEIEKQFIDTLTLLKDFDSNMVQFEISNWVSLNNEFQSKFPMISNLPKTETLPFHDEQFDQIINGIKHEISAFRVPTIHIQTSYQFDNVAMKMKAKKGFDGKKVGEIPVKEGDVVDVINSSYSEWYKVRTSNGMEGFVPCNYLIPTKV